MSIKMTFNELRKIKDSLPDGSMRKIAQEMGMEVETVRNYFGGANYERGSSAGVHFEPGPNGGVVLLNDTSILKRAEELIEEQAV